MNTVVNGATGPAEGGRCAAVILAAGSSSRLGQPKQHVRLGEDPEAETLLERTVRVAVEARLRPIYVVAKRPDGLERAMATLGDQVVVWVENNQAAEGMAASIRLGVAAIEKDAAGVVILACDQPAVTAEHLTRLVEGGDGDQAVASAYAGRRGVPAYLPRRLFAALMALSGDTGARVLLLQAQAIDLPDGEVDIDTAEDLAAARRLFQ